MDKKEQLKKAFDSSSLNWKLVLLNEEQATAFIDWLKDESAILKACRVVTPTKANTTIAKLFPNWRLLQPSTIGQKLADEKKGQFGTSVVEINCKPVKCEILVTDEEMMNNIEWGNFEDTMIKLVQKKIANELEEIGLYSRKRSTWSANSTLEMFDGWLWRLLQWGNVVNASDSSKFTNRLVDKAKFKSALKSLPVRFRPNSKFILWSDVLLDYQSAYDTVADMNVRNELMSTIIKKRVIEASLMGNSSPVVGSTELTIASVSWKVFTLDAVTWLQAWDSIVVSYNTSDQEVLTIDSVDWTDKEVTVVETPSLPHVAGQKVREATLDWSEAILTDPMNLIFAMQKSEMSFEVERIAWVGRNYVWKYFIDSVIEEATAGSLIHSMLTQD